MGTSERQLLLAPVAFAGVVEHVVVRDGDGFVVSRCLASAVCVFLVCVCVFLVCVCVFLVCVCVFLVCVCVFLVCVCVFLVCVCVFSLWVCAKHGEMSSSALQIECYNLKTGRRCTSHTNFLDRDRIKRCMMTMSVGLAGEPFLVVSGTGVTIGEDLREGQSWTMGVDLFVTVGVVLLGWKCLVHFSYLPTGRTVTREAEFPRQPSCMTLRSTRAETINHVREGENLESLMLFWRSAVAADGDVECTELSSYMGYSSCGSLQS